MNDRFKREKEKFLDAINMYSILNSSFIKARDEFNKAIQKNGQDIKIDYYESDDYEDEYDLAKIFYFNNLDLFGTAKIVKDKYKRSGTEYDPDQYFLDVTQEFVKRYTSMTSIDYETTFEKVNILILLEKCGYDKLYDKEITISSHSEDVKNKGMRLIDFICQDSDESSLDYVDNIYQYICENDIYSDGKLPKTDVSKNTKILNSLFKEKVKNNKNG